MIDLHCHLDLYPKPHVVVAECVARRMYVLSVTTTPSAWLKTVDLAVEAPRIRTALGLHPQIAHERKGELDLFDELLPAASYVGEIGLDGSPEYKRYWQDQQAVFVRILSSCAKLGGRVMTIHTRRAATPVLDALQQFDDAGTPILHWFSGTQRELTRAIDFGCWFSVGPAMLAGAKGRAIAASLPRERVLTESDGPFAQINQRSAWPWESDLAVTMLADVWHIPVDVVRQQLHDNLRRLSDSGSHPR